MFGNLMRDPEVKDLRDSINELSNKLAGKNLVEEMELSEQVIALKNQVTQLEIDKSKREEEFDKQKREVEHKIGLERKRAEQDLEHQKRTAKLEADRAVAEAEMKVREGNLDAEKQRMADEMNYIRKRMEDELESMRDMTSKVMEFIPKVNVDRRIREDYRDQPKAIDAGDESSGTAS